MLHSAVPDPAGLVVRGTGHQDPARIEPRRQIPCRQTAESFAYYLPVPAWW